MFRRYRRSVYRRRPVRRRRAYRPIKRRYATARRKPLTRRKLLNITSQKKRDNMLQVWQPSLLPGDRTRDQAGPISITAQAGPNWIFLWHASARTNQNVPGVYGTKNDVSTRTAQTAYIRGLLETYHFEGQDSKPFIHRRIVFTHYGTELQRDRNSAEQGRYFDNLDIYGVTRATTVVQNGADTVGNWPRRNLVELVFAGEEDIDWFDLTTAKTDTRRVRVLSDRRRAIHAPNDQGILRANKTWLPVNKSLIYNDEENAGGRNMSHYSADTRRSIGDIYVMDVIQLPTNFDSTLTMNVQSTLYWHER